jgi:hypothetical protein
MNPEEYLDRMIERRQYGQAWLPGDDNEVAACLVAAETLTRLQEINVPPAFAHRLETYVRARARTSGLHQQDGKAQQNGTFQQNGKVPAMALPLRPVRSAHPPRRRAWLSALSIAAALILACIGVLTASAHSLPGDLLYGVKQAENRLTLTFASDAQTRAGIQIDQLRSALADLRTVVNEGRGDDTISTALGVTAADTSESQQAVAALPAGSTRDDAQHNLDSALVEQKQALRGLLDHLDWPMQLAFTHQLGVLGDQVPTISSAQVRAQNNGTLLITLTGTNFAPQAAFILDGRPGGTIRQVTPTQLVAIINYAAWSHSTHTPGMRNPDGTAAQTTFRGSDNDNDQDDGGQTSPGNHATPGPDGESGDN